MSTLKDMRQPVLVAIPANNESKEIEGCLHALTVQRGAAIDGAVICLNNCTDDSAEVARRSAKHAPFPVFILDLLLPPGRACAGVARRIAMNHAANLSGPRGILLTTDADGRAPPDWVATNLAALNDDADAVAGQAEIEPMGAKLIPAHLHEIDAQECAYARLLDEIHWLLDSDPFDPWPRHDKHSGASIGVTVAAYRRAGGMPAVPLAEDRAFFDGLKRVDARIRHAPDIRVIVSARIVGRAPGGMADAMRRRMQRVDPLLDDRLEAVGCALRRIQIRKSLRRLWKKRDASKDSLAMLAARLRLPTTELMRLTHKPYFGIAWAAVEQRSPALQRKPVALIDLPGQMAQASRLRDAIHADLVRREEGPGDTALRVAAERHQASPPL